MNAPIADDSVTEVRDPQNNRRTHEAWKAHRQLHVAAGGDRHVVAGSNRAIILRFLEDLEYGLNTAPNVRKGPRSFARLNTVRTRMARLAWLFREHVGKDLCDLTDRDVVVFFHRMSAGEIATVYGKRFKSTVDYVKVFKAFWRWHVRVQRKKGSEVRDITVDLNSAREYKPPFVYFDHAEFGQLHAEAHRRMRTFMSFWYDSGIRPPKEFANVRRDEIVRTGRKTADLRIRDEASKTFGRTIKLLLCVEELFAWIEHLQLGAHDYVFNFTPKTVNQYLKRLGSRVFPGKTTLGRKAFDQLTMYDFRHSSCCYWLDKYPTQAGLMYRFGWKKPEQIAYYSELLGMRDKITHDDIADAESRPEILAELEGERQQRVLIQEQLAVVQEQLRSVQRANARREQADRVMTAFLKDVEVQEVLQRKLDRGEALGQAARLI